MREVRSTLESPGPGASRGVEEIAFVGLGEPMSQFGLIHSAIQELRHSGYKGRIRIDTNGLIKGMAEGLTLGRLELRKSNHAIELRRAGLTDIRISVNATNPSDYVQLCRPCVKRPFENIRAFVGECIGAGINTCVSFVVGFDDGTVRTRSPAEYERFALSSLGISPENILLREYIRPPESKKPATLPPPRPG
jgi:hypothetical protein